MRQKKTTAPVKIRLDAMGLGTVYVAGVEVGRYVRSTQVRSDVGLLTTVTIEINADLVDLECDEATILLNEYRDQPLDRAHDFTDKGICRVCRQVEHVAARVCPGPLKTSGNR